MWNRGTLHPRPGSPPPCKCLAPSSGQASGVSLGSPVSGLWVCGVVSGEPRQQVPWAWREPRRLYLAINGFLNWWQWSTKPNLRLEHA